MLDIDILSEELGFSVKRKVKEEGEG